MTRALTLFLALSLAAACGHRVTAPKETVCRTVQTVGWVHNTAGDSLPVVFTQRVCQ